MLQLKVGKISKKSYVPAGLSAAEYEKIRAKDKKEKDCKYQENAAKAGEFQDYTEFYVKRGTDTTDKWVKTVSRGHTFAKTKYDFSGQKDDAKTYDGSKKYGPKKYGSKK